MANYIEISVLDGEGVPRVRRIQDPDEDQSTHKVRTPDHDHEWGIVWNPNSEPSFQIAGRFGEFARHPENQRLWLTMVDCSSDAQLARALAGLVDNHKRQIHTLLDRLI